MSNREGSSDATSGNDFESKASNVLIINSLLASSLSIPGLSNQLNHSFIAQEERKMIFHTLRVFKSQLDICSSNDTMWPHGTKRTQRYCC